MQLARFRSGEKSDRVRPRFKVQSLMIAVVVAGLVSSLVSYELRLKAWASYHEAKYLEHIAPLSSQAGPLGVKYQSKLLDGTWSALHYKTPQAEWHESKKWGYMRMISRTNFFVVATLAGSAFLWFVIKAVLSKRSRDARTPQPLVPGRAEQLHA